jgi:hypothetical protein
MNAPKHCGHKPIISVNNYDEIDAHYRVNTDAKALSIGQAQYNLDEISLKVWRHNGKKWSRQSEEIPLHRNIDLNILLLGALMTDLDSGYPKTNLSEEVLNAKDVQKIKDYYSNHESFLKPRLEALREKLSEFLNK